MKYNDNLIKYKTEI